MSCREFSYLLYFALALACPKTATACLTPPVEQTAHYTQLIARTERIVLGRAVSTRRDSDRVNLYQFEVIETLKGPSVELVELPGKLVLLTQRSVYDPDFNDHNAGVFWDQRVTRQRNGADCVLRPSFREGEVYLLFLTEPYHWRSFEVVRSDLDLWLTEVRRLVQSNGIPTAQPVIELLSRRSGLSVDETVACRDSERFIRRLETIAGNAPAIRQFGYSRGRFAKGCEIGERFLTVHYVGDNALDPQWATGIPIREDRVDFSEFETEITILGETTIPLDTIRIRFKEHDAIQNGAVLRNRKLDDLTPVTRQPSLDPSDR